MSDAKSQEFGKRMASALASIDKQAPSLKYLGLSFWMAWNTIAFSGSFWLQDPHNSFHAEDLIFTHLVACVVTLIAFAVTSKRSRGLLAKRWFVSLGAAIAVAGTVLIVITRETIAPSHVLFTAGTVLSGAGTTVLFMKAMTLFGALPPRKSLSTLACCTLLAAALFFALNCCSNAVACAGFAALPALSAAFYTLHRKETPRESRAAQDGARPSRKLAVFLGSIAFCSFAFELAKGFVTVNLPPAETSGVALNAQFAIAFVMVAILVATLLVQDHYNYGKYYSLAVFVLGVLLVAVAVLPARSMPTAVLANAACNCFNLVVWGMLAYLVFQAESGALVMFGLGNASLSLGTALASLLLTATGGGAAFSDGFFRTALVILGIAVLIDLVFVFSEKQINELLVPLDQQRKAQDTLGTPERQPKQWVLTCEAIAEAQGLSAREREVFVALARGKTAQEIAERDVLSVYTVRAHIRSIYAKLDVHSRKELMKFIEDRLGE